VLGFSGDADLVVLFSVAVLGLVFGATGVLVAPRLPHNSIGWIFCVLGLLFESSGTADAYIAYGDGASVSPSGQAWVAWTSQWFLNVSSPTLIILCFMLFPTGRSPSARWRPLVWCVVGVALVNAASAALAPGTLADYPNKNPVGIESAGALVALAEASILVLIIPLMSLSVVSLFVRLRRSSGAERQQLKWFAYAAALLAAELLVVNVLNGLLAGTIDRETSELVSFVAFLAVLSGMPVAMGFAVLKYRLYDIDLLINRTLVYGSLTATLAFVYVGGVVSLQAALRALTGQESTLAVVVHPGDSRPVQPAASSGAKLRRSPLLPQEVRRGKDTCGLQRPLARGDGPRSPERRLGGGGQEHRAAGARLLVAAPRDGLQGPALRLAP
jgi:hypothetical protein